MSITLHLHPFLMHLADNKDLHQVNGTTVRECLEDIAKRYPDLEQWLFDEERNLKNLFELYVNMESALPEGLEKPVKDGDEINLVIIVAGG
jgi:molybdopterin converting factor small subunit